MPVVRSAHLDRLSSAAHRTIAPRTRRVLAVPAALAFVGALILNLCWPEPRGPADQGDFSRVVPGFSSGPVGLALWPERDDPQHELRFSHSYLRHWRLDGGIAGWARPSASDLVFLPERLRPRSATAPYDLARNTAYVAVLLGVVVAAAVWCSTRPIPLAALLATVLVFADLRVAWYLNSFYQEAGTFCFALVFVCLLLVALQRASAALVFAALVVAGFLAASKLAYAPSAALLGFAAIGAALLLARTRAMVIACAAGGAVVVIATIGYVQHARQNFQDDVVYNFLFTTALPALREGDRPAYLEQIGLPGDLASRSGASVYETVLEPALRARLTNRLHARAVWTLATRHPAAFMDALSSGFARAGIYDLRHDGYGYRERGAPDVEAPRVEAWSRWRAALLPGFRGYVAALALLVLALSGRGARRASPWLGVFVVLGAGALGASLLQVAIAILGNGCVDLLKHLYFANLTCDLALVLGGAALAEGILRAPAVQCAGAGAPSRRRRAAAAAG